MFEKVGAVHARVKLVQRISGHPKKYIWTTLDVCLSNETNHDEQSLRITEINPGKNIDKCRHLQKIVNTDL